MLHPDNINVCSCDFSFILSESHLNLEKIFLSQTSNLTHLARYVKLAALRSNATLLKVSMRPAMNPWIPENYNKLKKIF